MANVGRLMKMGNSDRRIRSLANDIKACFVTVQMHGVAERVHRGPRNPYGRTRICVRHSVRQADRMSKSHQFTLEPVHKAIPKTVHAYVIVNAIRPAHCRFCCSRHQTISGFYSIKRVRSEPLTTLTHFHCAPPNHHRFVVIKWFFALPTPFAHPTGIALRIAVRTVPCTCLIDRDTNISLESGVQFWICQSTPFNKIRVFGMWISEIFVFCHSNLCVLSFAYQSVLETNEHQLWAIHSVRWVRRVPQWTLNQIERWFSWII